MANQPANGPLGTLPWTLSELEDGTLFKLPGWCPAALTMPAAALNVATAIAAQGVAAAMAQASTASGLPVTREQVLRIMPKAGVHQLPWPLADVLTAMNNMMGRYGISANRRRQAAFLAQVAVECAQLTEWNEGTSEAYQTKHYENNKNLGNSKPGDGVRFRGRGPLQLTGRDNYTRCGTYLRKHGFANAHLDADPDQVRTQLTVGCETAGWYWAKSRGKRDASVMADKLRLTTDATERAQFNAISRFVNGGDNGLDDRWKFYKQAVATFATGGR